MPAGDGRSECLRLERAQRPSLASESTLMPFRAAGTNLLVSPNRCVSERTSPSERRATGTLRERATTYRIMSAVKHRGGVAEIAIRRRLWLNGLRFRVNTALPGKPDLVFLRQRIAVFIDGDLWHGNSWRVRGLQSLEAQFPSNTEWWTHKITANIERDARVNERLAMEGWRVLRYWESTVLSDPNSVAEEIAAHVRPNRVPLVPLPPTALERKRLASVVPKRSRQAR